jgi:hypothetical protein
MSVETGEGMLKAKQILLALFEVVFGAVVHG